MMKADEQKVAWLYFDDLGESYWTSAKYGTVKQKDDDGRPLVGGRSPTGMSELSKVRLLSWAAPGGLKVRTVTVVNLENGHRRQVVIYSLDAPLWVGTATAIQMREEEPIEAGSQYVNLVQRTFQVRGGKDELYRGRRRRDKTAQPVPTPGASDVFDSTIEAIFAEAWKRTTKLEVVSQHLVLGYRLDFAHLPTRTAIELDGYYYHADPERFRKDRQRDRALAAQGWRVVRFAGDEVLANVERCVEETIRLIRAHSLGVGDSA
jgi:very-short-patch-repair endonuclease